jgi:hypothetical protein
MIFVQTIIKHCNNNAGAPLCAGDLCETFCGPYLIKAGGVLKLLGSEGVSGKTATTATSAATAAARSQSRHRSAGEQKLHVASFSRSLNHSFAPLNAEKRLFLQFNANMSNNVMSLSRSQEFTCKLTFSTNP